MYFKNEKTHYRVFTAFAVFITASVVAGPTYFGSDHPSKTFTGSGSSFGGSDRFSRQDRYPSGGSQNSEPSFSSNGWNRPPSDNFDGFKPRRGDWNPNDNLQFPNRDWYDRDQCGDWNGNTPAVPTPGSILLASVGLSVVGLMRKRTVG